MHLNGKLELFKYELRGIIIVVFDHWTNLHDLNTGLVHYSDPHCIPWLVDTKSWSSTLGNIWSVRNCKNMQKTKKNWFWPVLGVCSTQTLVKIYNSWMHEHWYLLIKTKIKFVGNTIKSLYYFTSLYSNIELIMLNNKYHRNIQ